ncbi:MAG TPA: styrene monooxygenase/indole monooxygenase family protein [Herpetosiphonaceae bacterium]
MTNIGIVGAGVAGLQLGLYLRQHNIETTLYAERSPEQQFGSRLPALVARVGHTRERERQLGVNHWDGGNNEFGRLNVYISGEQPLSFTGHASSPLIAVDMRIYLGRLQEDFVARGGHVVVGAVDASDLERLSEQHDLLVVAAGRGGLLGVFPRIDELSPFDRPQRWIATGIFRGIRANPSSASVIFAPGHGEIFEFPIYSFEPNVTGLGIEAAPGSAFEEAVRMRYEDDPQRFNRTWLDLIREHAPLIYERIDPERFELTRPLDLLQGGVTPAVRRGYAQLGNGRYIMALGDAHVTNDPITGQGANTASRVAFMLGEAIRNNPTFDEGFFQWMEQRVIAYAGQVAKWSNAMLQPPQDHMIELMVAAAHNQAVADAFAGFFEQPVIAWQVMSSAESTAEFLRQFGWQGMPQMLQAA